MQLLSGHAPHTQKDITSLGKSKGMQHDLFATISYSRFASVSEMLSYLNWPIAIHASLQCRIEQKAVMMFKSVHNLVDIPANKFLLPISTALYTRGHHI